MDLSLTGLFLAAGWRSARTRSIWLKIGNYQREAFSRDVTRCDELASHPDDPERVSQGIPQSSVGYRRGACRLSRSGCSRPRQSASELPAGPAFTVTPASTARGMSIGQRRYGRATPSHCS